ncbi:MAG: formylglycine-generating enzyme family protein [Thermosynechococcaceae cyanobacterium]
MTNLTIKRYRKQIQYFEEHLGRDETLAMMLIPPGSFMMGAPESELESGDDERPQHNVNISPFFMGKYPVTQAQWKAIAEKPQINREIALDPSHFKNETGDLPVECVSWLDAVEFCDRLSRYTHRPYRLPSEAEWEYACRAGTTTPFHFGETITTELANYRGTDNPEYDWSGSYGAGPKGIYREKTTPVGSFGVANDFGLYDMHGNVWEWCEDHWHDTYTSAPTDGRAWIDNADKSDENARRLLRGGSWYNIPRTCRSARRVNFIAGVEVNFNFGFRVVCSAARTS